MNDLRYKYLLSLLENNPSNRCKIGDKEATTYTIAQDDEDEHEIQLTPSSIGLFVAFVTVESATTIPTCCIRIPYDIRVYNLEVPNLSIILNKSKNLPFDTQEAENIFNKFMKEGIYTFLPMFDKVDDILSKVCYYSEKSRIIQEAKIKLEMLSL